MYQAGLGELMFFEAQPGALPLYEAFMDKLLNIFPATSMRVQKTQITLSNRYVYLCISFARVKRKAELPNPYLVVTLGLPYRLESDRVAVQSEPYPGRWTTHVVVGSESELDEELFTWIRQAYEFSANK